MSEYKYGGSSSLPNQKVTEGERTEEWKRSSVNYYVNFRYTNGTNLRTDRNRKIINYDLANGRVSMEDVRKICDPMNDSTATFAESFMHHDKVSPIIHALLGEESLKPDNAIVYSESAADITRKNTELKSKIVESLKMTLMGSIDPSTIDPNNPPPTPEEILKMERMNPSDILESKSNKLLKILKKKCQTKLLLNQGFKDALIAGEEIYWTGILNGEPAMRRCNPLNMTVILDDSDTFIDDAIAVIEERLLTIPSIIDEYGDELKPKDLEKLQSYSNGIFGTFNSTGGFTPVFNVVDGQNVLGGVTPSSSATGNNSSNFSLRVIRVEWMGMKQVGTLTYSNPETGEVIKKLVDESFKSMVKDFKTIYTDAKVDWFWINDAWEGVRIGDDIYIGIQSKANQRRRMDNPYYSKLGYTGFIYEATNSKSVSVVDRIKSLVYLYDIISWKVQLLFGSDMGRVVLMDMAQIPVSQGIDIEKWIYYLKESKIMFINSFEEGKQGVKQGQTSAFNQFQSIDMSLANSVNQYIEYLSYIDEQIFAVSGVSRQRMANVKTSEAVSNVEATIERSETITQYLFDMHQEVKRRVYTSLIEVAKIAYRNGMVTQFVNDDLTLEILQLEEFEFENSDLGVFVSNLDKDRLVKSTLDRLAQVAMEQQKMDISHMIDAVLSDSPKDIVNILKRAEGDYYQRQQENAKAEQDASKQIEQMRIEHEQTVWAQESEEKQKDRDLKQYEIDENNRVKIETAEMTAYAIDEGPNTADISGAADSAIKQQELSAKTFLEQQKLLHDKTKHDKELTLKAKELQNKKELESKKIEAIQVQNRSQEKMQDKQLSMEDKKLKAAAESDKLKAKTAIQVAKMKPKPKAPAKKK